MRVRLRTLLIALALLPPLLAGGWIWGWREYAEWKQRQEQERQAAEMRELVQQLLAAQDALYVGPPPMTAEERARIKKMLIETDIKSPPDASENSD